jgi:hypothetical protein
MSRAECLTAGAEQYSVWVVPEPAPSCVRRVLAGITLDDTGAEVLAKAARICSDVGAEELIAVHCTQPELYLLDEDGEERCRSERLLGFLRYLARVAPRGMSCTPVLEEAAEPERGLMRAVAERGAELVVIPARARMASALVSACGVPVVQVPRRRETLPARIRRFFSRPEPKYN